MAGRQNFEAAIEDRIKILTKMVEASTHISDEQREELLVHMAGLAEKVSNKPMSLGDLQGGTGDTHLQNFEDVEKLKENAEDPIEFDEEAIKHWKTLCWRARFDMSESEMLLLSEKTMKSFIHAYGHPAPEIALNYWKFLVKRYAEIEKVESARGLQPKACKSNASGSQAGSVKPKERHAGAVVASGTMVSQRTEALPDGITEGVYKPEVASPTAAMWKQGPRTPDGGSARREGSGSPSTYGSRSIATKSVAARSVAGRSVASPASLRGDNSSRVEHKQGWAR